jgi:membrane peptidoglycan carboxypeptidase
VGRKLREARLAMALEETYSKDEILTRYLNIVYFGHGAYGIQAAAQKYFSVNAIDLTLPQAAMLAGLVQSPTNDDPISNPENAVVRRNQVLQRMFDLGHITEQELTEISAQPVAVAEGADAPNGCIDAAIGGFFCAYVVNHLTRELGLSEVEIKRSGLTIQTTLRPDLQAHGDQAVLNTLAMGEDLAGMFTAIQPGTGHVLAMSVNRRYGCSDPECESVVLNDVASKGAGSTYKVFTAAAALEAGIGAGTTISTPGNRYTSRIYRNGGRPYSIGNAGNYPDTLDMVGALVRSSNTYFLALEDRLGSVEGPVRMSERMGMTYDQPNQDPADQIIDENRGSFTLGAEATSPLDLANAYATLGAQGTRCEPTPVVAVLDRAGKPLTDDEGRPVVSGNECTPAAVPPAIANTLSHILVGDVATPAGTGTRAAVPGHEIAGKTGTSQGRDSVAFVGFMPEYAASVMVFNPKAKEDVGGFGGNMPATIWRDAMAPFLADKPTSPFPPADQSLLNGGRPAPRPTPRPSPSRQSAPAPTAQEPEDSAEPQDGGGQPAPAAGQEGVAPEAPAGG